MCGVTDSELLERLRRSPDQDVELIVTVEGDPRDYEGQLQAFNLKVKRTFFLTQKLALGGAARAFIALSHENWVIKMEEDKPVQTMD